MPITLTISMQGSQEQVDTDAAAHGWSPTNALSSAQFIVNYWKEVIANETVTNLANASIAAQQAALVTTAEKEEADMLATIEQTVVAAVIDPNPAPVAPVQPVVDPVVPVVDTTIATDAVPTDAATIDPNAPAA